MFDVRLVSMVGQLKWSMLPVSLVGVVRGSFGWADIVADSKGTAPRGRLRRAGRGSGLERVGEIVTLGNELGVSAMSSTGIFVRTKRSK